MFCNCTSFQMTENFQQNFSLPDILPKLDPNLMRILRSVGSTDTITARAGLNELNDILESPEKQAALRDYEEIYIDNVCLQLKVCCFCFVSQLFHVINFNNYFAFI